MESQTKIINFLEKLIKYKTTSDDIKNIEQFFNFIENKFQKNFFIKKYFHKNYPILILSNTKKKKFDIMFLCHADVVDGKDSQFFLKQKGDKLFARGTLDMKGQLAAILFAVKKAIAVNKNISVGILITSDEEISGDGAKYLANEKNYRATVALIPDGGDNEIIISQKGFMQLKAIARGKSCHASRPWEGQNAIEIAKELSNRIKNKFPSPKSKTDWRSSINLTKIISGNALNSIPDTAELFFDIRFINDNKKQQILDAFYNTFGVKNISIVEENGALNIDPKNKIIEHFNNIAKQVKGKKVNLDKECGTSDAIFFAEKGIPSFLFRAKGGGNHADDEWISISSLMEFYKIIYLFLLNYNKKI